MCVRQSLAFSSGIFFCHQLLKSWLIHAQKLQVFAGCDHCRSHLASVHSHFTSLTSLIMLIELKNGTELGNVVGFNFQLHLRTCLLPHQLEDFDDDVLEDDLQGRENEDTTVVSCKSLWLEMSDADLARHAPALRGIPSLAITGIESPVLLNYAGTM